MTNTHRYILRAVIEFTTPFIVGSGNEDIVSDAVCVTDHNGLPAIPGSSIAGVLRSAYTALHGENVANNLFGYQDGKVGEGSRLRISWAVIHDSNNSPAEGLMNGISDLVLVNAMNPKIRDHVRINHLGASDAENHGKFDDKALCAGHRFTFEMEFMGDETHQSSWMDLINIITSNTLRLGGNTRSGYGTFKVIQTYNKTFKLSDNEDWEEYLKHPISLKTPVQWDQISDDTAGKSNYSTKGTKEFILLLKPVGFWMFGGGDDIAGENIDMVPVRNSYIKWDGAIGSCVDDVLTIPATGIKGAISHRVAFNYNAIAGNFIKIIKKDDKGEERKLTEEERKIEKEKLTNCTSVNNVAVKELFGYAKDSENKKEGKRGRVIIDDILIRNNAPKQKILNHVTIDRYTGGALDTALFDEKPLWKNNGENIDFELELKIIVDGYDILDENIKKAFEMTIEELRTGKLQVGAGNGRGNGYFTGTKEEKYHGEITEILKKFNRDIKAEPGILTINSSKEYDLPNAITEINSFKGTGWICSTDNKKISIVNGDLPAGIDWIISGEFSNGSNSMHVMRTASKWQITKISRNTAEYNGDSILITSTLLTRGEFKDLLYEVMWSPVKINELAEMHPTAYRFVGFVEKIADSKVKGGKQL